MYEALSCLFQQLPEEFTGFVVIGVEIPRVDADFFHHRHHGHGNVGTEMDIGHQRDIGRYAKSVIHPIAIPTVAQIREKQDGKNLAKVREALSGEIPLAYQTMAGKLMAEGHEPALIASAAMQLCFARNEEGLADIVFELRPFR